MDILFCTAVSLDRTVDNVESPFKFYDNGPLSKQHYSRFVRLVPNHGQKVNPFDAD